MDAQAWRASAQSEESWVRWSRQLRTACQTLSIASADAIRTISVSGAFSGTAAAVQALEVLARCLAEEYLLRATVHFDELVATFHFQRKGDIEQR